MRSGAGRLTCTCSAPRCGGGTDERLCGWGGGASVWNRCGVLCILSLVLRWVILCNGWGVRRHKIGIQCVFVLRLVCFFTLLGTYTRSASSCAHRAVGRETCRRRALTPAWRDTGMESRSLRLSHASLIAALLLLLLALSFAAHTFVVRCSALAGCCGGGRLHSQLLVQVREFGVERRDEAHLGLFCQAHALGR